MASKNKFISVFIPVYNGEKYLRECIDTVLAQELPSGYELELLITDSGSKDNSVQILEGYGNKIIFDQIPNKEFGHGRTRQRAADKARGDFILFLSQDATPSHNRWLINMIEPFFLSNKVGCVFGRQVPRPDSVPTIKREVSSVFNNFGVTESIVIARHTSLVDGKKQTDIDAFFSDVNSAIRKDINQTIKFRDLPYAEDQAMAEDLQKAGYFKAYAPQGSVWHSNEYTAREYRKRKFDEYIGLQESIGYKVNPSLRSLMLGWVRPTLADWEFLRKDREYGKKLKLKYMVGSVGYNMMAGRGKYEAGKHFNDKDKRAKISLESTRKKKNNS